MKKKVQANHFHRTWTAAGFAMLAIIVIPFFANAVNGQSVSDGTSSGNQTAALISALSNLESRIADLAIAFRQSQQTSAGTTADGSALANGMPQCLTQCRSSLAVCLRSSSSTSTSEYARVQTAPLAAAGAAGLDACRTRANDCINACRPTQAPVVSCEDRCAVALGGCLVSAGTDTAKLKDCREQNARCLIAACAGTPGSTTSRVPSQICREQCARDRAICQRAARFDTLALRRCDDVANICLQQVCLASDVIPQTLSPQSPNVLAPAAPASGGAATGATGALPAGQQTTINCENTCTQTYTACSATASGDQTKQASCDASYGDCRGQCLVLIGGGM